MFWFPAYYSSVSLPTAPLKNHWFLPCIVVLPGLLWYLGVVFFLFVQLDVHRVSWILGFHKFHQFQKTPGRYFLRFLLHFISSLLWVPMTYPLDCHVLGFFIFFSVFSLLFSSSGTLVWIFPAGLFHSSAVTNVLNPALWSPNFIYYIFFSFTIFFNSRVSIWFILSHISLDIFGCLTSLPNNSSTYIPCGSFSFFCFLSFAVQSFGPFSALLGNFYSVPKTVYVLFSWPDQLNPGWDWTVSELSVLRQSISVYSPTVHSPGNPREIACGMFQAPPPWQTNFHLSHSNFHLFHTIRLLEALLSLMDFNLVELDFSGLQFGFLIPMTLAQVLLSFSALCCF